MTELEHLIKTRLHTTFMPQRLELIAHDPPPPFRNIPNLDQEGYFRLLIVSSQFTGKPLTERHRSVYITLGPLMENRIHALTVYALTPEEFTPS